MPTLEITADNVVCSHGAAVSDLDENSMFYLGARGIDRKVLCCQLLSRYDGHAQCVKWVLTPFCVFAYVNNNAGSEEAAPEELYTGRSAARNNGKTFAHNRDHDVAVISIFYSV
jgi:SUF system FeS cluster assembly, SufBD